MRLFLCAALLGILCPAFAPAQNPTTPRLFTSDAVQIRYLEEGSGEPVLLIHGLGGRLENWTADGFLAGLAAAGFRVIAYDARGHGESSKPHDSDRYGDEDVADVLRLLDHLSIERAHVIGYSRGSWIASELVAQHPDRVSSVVYGAWGGNPSHEVCLATVDALARGEFPVPLWRALQSSDAPLPTKEEQAMLMERFFGEADMMALAAAVGASCADDLESAASLNPSGVPWLAIVGALDGASPSVLAMARETGGELQVYVIPGADHFTARRHPEFLAQILSFLNETRSE
jgi:pimeloyl-ACP methyl ester carboxylesterase